MSCRKNVRWYVESMDGNMYLVDSGAENLQWSHKTFNIDPHPFKSLKKARKIAAENGGQVRYYGKFRYIIHTNFPH